MKFQGGCYCGAIRYAVDGEPLFQAQCQCRPCQYVSGGGPNFFIMMPVGAFSYTQGTVSQFTRPDLDAPRTRDFCPTCGTHLTTRQPGGQTLVVKVGTMDDPTLYGGPSAAIHMAEAQPFHCVAKGVPQYDRLPPR
ncbi:hypothetical protein ATO6_03965 [Oceanicola sp. 22II-s10i]|uniref:GFA family protein n=1 Tax=Oceanicola sp. 22II-s10i TaxID=1317116 RepID=UPI000B521571|nr:GFA family protein [Oceanicola sp. 22II-s10i]OWU86034.1 hypothetical protein ATO6_03965 [Oceanicola sp. 22II-s10i]